MLLFEQTVGKNFLFCFANMMYSTHRFTTSLRRDDLKIRELHEAKMDWSHD